MMKPVSQCCCPPSLLGTSATVDNNHLRVHDMFRRGDCDALRHAFCCREYAVTNAILGKSPRLIRMSSPEELPDVPHSDTGEGVSIGQMDTYTPKPTTRPKNDRWRQVRDLLAFPWLSYSTWRRNRHGHLKHIKSRMAWYTPLVYIKMLSH